MAQYRFALPCFVAIALAPAAAHAVASAELYTSASYRYGRIEARVQYAAGSGVVSSFFLWKDGSEIAGTFWNELDFEKVGEDCRLETNALYGTPVKSTPQKATLAADLCGGFHTYTYEWTPEAIVWLVDGQEIRRETGAVAAAYSDNAPVGMQIRFNVWPGDITFGGAFNPSILPVHQAIDWVEYSSYADGQFTVEWREDFNGTTVPTNWLTGSWGSPKNLSVHNPANVNLVGGYAILSLTADDALGPKGATPGMPSVPGGGNADPKDPNDSGGDDGCSVASGPSSRGSALVAVFTAIAGLFLGRRRSFASHSVQGTRKG